MGSDTSATVSVMNGNTLAVVLFLLSVSVSFYVQTLQPRIQRTRILMRVIAVLMFLLAVAWPFLSSLSPTFAMSEVYVAITHLASNAWAWFILLMVTLFVNSVLPVMERRKQDVSVSASRNSFQEEQKNDRSLFSRFVLAERMLSDSVLLQGGQLVSVRIIYANRADESFAARVHSFFRLRGWQAEIHPRQENVRVVGIRIVGCNHQLVTAVTNLLRTVGLSEAESEVEAPGIPRDHSNWEVIQNSLRVVIGCSLRNKES